jgi:putative membrane protein
MAILLKLLLSALAVIISAYVIPGVNVDGFLTALVVAVILGLLNAFVKPVLVILTIPITILTLGLFYLVINVIIIYIAAAIVPGFVVAGFLSALFFSIVLALVSWLIDAMF